MQPPEARFQIRCQSVFNLYIRCVYALNQHLQELHFIGSNLSLTDRAAVALGLRNEADLLLFARCVEAEAVGRENAFSFREDVLTTLQRFKVSEVFLLEPMSPELRYQSDEEVFACHQVPWTAYAPLQAQIAQFVRSNHDCALWKELGLALPGANLKLDFARPCRQLPSAAKAKKPWFAGIRGLLSKIRFRRQPPPSTRVFNI